MCGLKDVIREQTIETSCVVPLPSRVNFDVVPSLSLRALRTCAAPVEGLK